MSDLRFDLNSFTDLICMSSGLRELKDWLISVPTIFSSKLIGIFILYLGINVAIQSTRFICPISVRTTLANGSQCKLF